MYSLRQRKKHRVETLVNDLAEYLVQSENDAETSWQDTLNLLLNEELLTNEAAPENEDENDGMEGMIKLAAAKCKSLQRSKAENETKASKRALADDEKRASAAAAKSFSLFDNIGSFSLDAFVTADQLEEAQELSTSSAQDHVLVLLEKVQHVDDVMHSWQDIVLPSVSKGIRCQLTKHRYIKLCRTWFFEQLDNREMERLLARNDLCHVLSFAMPLHTTHDALATEADFSIQIVQLWHDMWMAILPHYPHLPKKEEENGMERCILRQFSLSSSALPLLLAMVDEYATWFTCWAQQIQPLELSKMLCECQELIPYLLEHGRSLQPTRVPPSLATEANVHNVLAEAILVQALCMLRGILIVTRVVLFPWNLALPKAEGKESYVSVFTTMDPTPEQANLFVNLFAHVLRIGMSQSNTVSPQLARTCGEAITVLLMGCRHLDEVIEGLFDTVTKRLLVVGSSKNSGEESPDTIMLCQSRCALLQLCNDVLQNELGTDAQRQVLIKSVEGALRNWVQGNLNRAMETADEVQNVMEMLLYESALVLM